MEIVRVKVNIIKPFKPPHEVDDLGYPVDPIMRNLQRQLSYLAGELRGMARGDLDEAQWEIVREYHAVMKQLYEMGWDAILDMEAELPEHLMPEEYLRRHPLLD